jgi:hypothetical protein
MALKPWYKVVVPREDLREGRPLDAAEFAVHLDKIRLGTARDVYQDPKQFFERTYLTKSLEGFAAEVIRRLSGIHTETSAVFNMSTQFGGGKTHSLALLYHLVKNSSEAASWMDVTRIIGRAEVSKIPSAKTAIFVGTEFDALVGRSEGESEPLRKTPLGEIAWQLGGEEAFNLIAKHDEQMLVPGNDVIRKIFEMCSPCIILMDELLNFASRFRSLRMNEYIHNLIQNLSEEARGQDKVVLVISIPASELEMTVEDQSDFERYKKLLDRLGKPIMLSAEGDTSEIIRRRLFEWDGLPDAAKKTIDEYADWVVDHRNQMGDFTVDHAKERFAATYPFHPTVISVFERKWQGLPRFQQTRGILRLLALWVSNAYNEGYKEVKKDSLITLGTAPLDDLKFRAAVFEQLGEDKLDTPVTTDICGKSDSNSVILDNEAVQSIKKAKLHQKASKTIFFESNGGQSKTEATVPEIRAALGGPDVDLGNIETVLEGLTESCYFLYTERNRYHFGTKATLVKMLADRRAAIKKHRIDEQVKAEVQKVFKPVQGVGIIFFPEKSSQITDRPNITFVINPPDKTLEDEKKTLQQVDAFTKEYGASSRSFKSALIWVVGESPHILNEQALKLLAWEDIKDESRTYKLDDTQKRQLDENIKRSKRDLTEAVWRTYKNLVFLGKDNQLKKIDFGLIHSSSAESIFTYFINQLRKDGDIEKEGISPNFLVRNWPPAFQTGGWSTKSVRDAFFASPQFPRLLNPDVIKETIIRGVANGSFGYVGKTGSGKYDPFYFEEEIGPLDVEILDDMFIITRDEAIINKEPPKISRIEISPKNEQIELGKTIKFSAIGFDQYGNEFALKDITWETNGEEIDKKGQLTATDEGILTIKVTSEDIGGSTNLIVRKKGTSPTGPGGRQTLLWEGVVPTQKWMNFYTKVITKFATDKTLALKLSFKVSPEGGVSEQKIEEIKTALKELGMEDDITTE